MRAMIWIIAALLAVLWAVVGFIVWAYNPCWMFPKPKGWPPGRLGQW
jgi:hypothetical protein